MNRLLLGCLLLTAALAAWANRPDPDPWADVPADGPHPRIGARVTLAPERWVHLPPPDQMERMPDGRTHRFWHSWCPHDDERWGVHQ